MSIINCVSLNVMFGGSPVLRDITFAVEQGESVAVLGESGCGKTVLLKTLIGLNAPSSGQVFFDNCDLGQLSYFELAQIRTRFGFVFQQAALFDSMTIEENVAFPLVQHTNKKRDEIQQIVARLLAEVGLDERTLQKKPAELSGGMRKRVGVARALALEPEVLLYDEPTTGLDPVMSSIINELMVSVRSMYNVTSIMVTHDLHSANTVAGRFIMLAPLAKLDAGQETLTSIQNQIVFDGTPQEFASSHNEFVQLFLKGSG